MKKTINYILTVWVVAKEIWFGLFACALIINLIGKFLTWNMAWQATTCGCLDGVKTSLYPGFGMFRWLVLIAAVFTIIRYFVLRDEYLSDVRWDRGGTKPAPFPVIETTKKSFEYIKLKSIEYGIWKDT